MFSPVGGRKLFKRTSAEVVLVLIYDLEHGHNSNTKDNKLNQLLEIIGHN